MQHSENIAELMTALIIARKEFKAVHKSAANPFFKSKYADLSEIVSATHDALTNNDLVVLQSPGSFDGGKSTLTTMIAHTSGQWIKGDFQMPVVKGDPQGVGSSITYMRRYSLQAFLNIAADLDDDCESGVVHETPAVQMPKPLRSTDTTIMPQNAPPSNPHGFSGAQAAGLQQPSTVSDDMPANDPPKKREWVQIAGCISEPQGKRFWAIGKARKLDNAAIQAFMGSHGFEGTNEITKAAYQGMVEQLEVM